jgi:hypothetical protein
VRLNAPGRGETPRTPAAAPAPRGADAETSGDLGNGEAREPTFGEQLKARADQGGILIMWQNKWVLGTYGESYCRIVTLDVGIARSP